jgi:hypothetical protein
MIDFAGRDYPALLGHFLASVECRPLRFGGVGRVRLQELVSDCFPVRVRYAESAGSSSSAKGISQNRLRERKLAAVSFRQANGSHPDEKLA